MRRPLRFLTSNPGKAAEVSRLLASEVETVSIDLLEPQLATSDEVVRFKARRAVELVGPPLLVEDVSLGLTALGGFPGPYVKWLLLAAGGSGLGTIASALEDRSAVARCCLAYADGGELSVFVGEIAGRILTVPRGEGGFGWDPWFEVAELGRTLAELSPEEKDQYSHRGKAFALLNARRAHG